MSFQLWPWPSLRSCSPSSTVSSYISQNSPREQLYPAGLYLLTSQFPHLPPFHASSGPLQRLALPSWSTQALTDRSSLTWGFNVARTPGRCRSWPRVFQTGHCNLKLLLRFVSNALPRFARAPEPLWRMLCGSAPFPTLPRVWAGSPVEEETWRLLNFAAKSDPWSRQERTSV